MFIGDQTSVYIRAWTIHNVTGRCQITPGFRQSDFINERDGKNIEKLCKLVNKEKELTILLYDMMQKNSFIGYEAANHYYYTKSMLAEKVLNCEYILNKLKSVN